MAMKQHTEAQAAAPRYNAIEKVVVSVGVGKLRASAQFDEKILPEIERELTSITGQKPARRAAKQSISGFKTREGDVVGLQVTLRDARMRDFLTKILTIVLPRVRDFRGLPERSIDEHGNLNIGFREQLVFPEIEAERSRVTFGVQVTIVPRNQRRDNAIAFYRDIGVPLREHFTPSKPK